MCIAPEEPEPEPPADEELTEDQLKLMYEELTEVSFINRGGVFPTSMYLASMTNETLDAWTPTVIRLKHDDSEGLTGIQMSFANEVESPYITALNPTDQGWEILEIDSN